MFFRLGNTIILAQSSTSVKLECLTGAGCFPGSSAGAGRTGGSLLGGKKEAGSAVLLLAQTRAATRRGLYIAELRGEGAWSGLQAQIGFFQGLEGAYWGMRPAWMGVRILASAKTLLTNFLWSSDSGDECRQECHRSALHVTWRRNLWNEFKGRGLVTPLLERHFGGRAFKLLIV